MNKGMKIVLGIVSFMVLLAVGFSAGIVFTYVVYNTDAYEGETVSLEEEPLEEVTSEELALESISAETVPLEESIPLEDMGIDELLEHFEENEYPVTWPVLWVVATNIDADGTYEGTPVHANIQMPQEEKDFYMYDMSESFERTVEEFTGGLVDIELTKVLYENPITYLDGDENCLAPQSFDEDMQAYFTDYNSVICTARFCEPYEPIVSQDWLGLAYITDAIPYGFCQIASNYEYDDSIFKASENNPYEAEPWIHEWIHTLEPLCTNLGSDIPNPDSAEIYRYECRYPDGINGFFDYYHDTVTASVWDFEQEMYIGITPAMWRTMAYYYDQMRLFK